MLIREDIKNAFHALALDDHREAFTPTLWSLPKVEKPTPEAIATQQKAVDDALQAWYPVAYDKNTERPIRDALKTAYNKARRDLIQMEEAARDRSKLKQVWFPGVHINIGGGSDDSLKDKGDLEGLYTCLTSYLEIQHKSFLLTT